MLTNHHARATNAATFVFGLLLVAGCGNEPAGPLVGTWEELSAEETNNTGMSLTYTFENDGTLNIGWQRLLHADTVLSANYTVQWDSVLTLSDARGTEQFIAHVFGDTLTLRSEEGMVQQYARLP